MKDENCFRELDRQWTQYGDYAPEDGGDVKPPRATRTCQDVSTADACWRFCEGCAWCLPATE
jgi:hypothetical protein